MNTILHKLQLQLAMLHNKYDKLHAQLSPHPQNPGRYHEGSDIPWDNLSIDQRETVMLNARADYNRIFDELGLIIDEIHEYEEIINHHVDNS